jgi:hypothetical protein
VQHALEAKLTQHNIVEGVLRVFPACFRARARERQTDRQTDRERQKEKDRKRQREGERERDLHVIADRAEADDRNVCRRAERLALETPAAC